MNEGERILESLQNIGVLVVKKDTLSILYHNASALAMMPELGHGSIPEELYKELLSNHNTDFAMDILESQSTLEYVHIFVQNYNWESGIPAYMVTVTKLSDSEKFQVNHTDSSYILQRIGGMIFNEVAEIYELDFENDEVYGVAVLSDTYKRVRMGKNIDFYLKKFVMNYVDKQSQDEISLYLSYPYLTEYFLTHDKLTFQCRRRVKKKKNYAWHDYTIYKMEHYKARYIVFVKNVDDLIIKQKMQEQAVKNMMDKMELTRREKELSEQQSLLMISQFNPHFLFNVLNSIKAVMYTDPDKASEMISYFARCIRGNLRSIGKMDFLSFPDELEHIRVYLHLETMRYPKIKYELNINEQDFLVPPMSIQPLVENAITKGLCANGNKGMLTVSTWKEKDCFVIEIQDDGAGFIVNEAFDKKSTLFITRKRIQELMHGTIQIKSLVGRGSTITVRIPKEFGIGEGRHIDEDDSGR